MSSPAEDELKLPDGWKEWLYTFNYVPTETEKKTGMVDELWTIAREVRSLVDKAWPNITTLDKYNKKLELSPHQKKESSLTWHVSQAVLCLPR